MKLDLRKIWKDRDKIVEGVLNSVFIKEEIEKIASERRAICQSNQCGHFDQYGTSEKVTMRGLSACGVCGCNILWLTHSMSSECSLSEINQEPLWKAELDKDQENQL